VKNLRCMAMTVSAILFTSAYALAQLPKDPEERAKVITQIMQTSARQLTLFDREGKELNAFAPRDLYNQPVFSPDSKRMAVIKANLEKESNDLWVYDIATGQGKQITFSDTREQSTAPAWSPDGRYVAYAALRQGAFGLYRKASNGEGAEEQLYKSSSPVTLTDWSQDGRYLTYFATDLGGGAIFALPLNTTGERKPIEMYRSSKQVQGPRLSPDGRFVAYVTNETGKNELYVRPFNPAAAPGATPSAGPWKISEDGAQGMAFWRRDGKELTFLTPDRGIMSVSLTTSPDFEFSKPKLLFRVPETTPVGPGTASVNRDVDRFVIAVPPPQLRQITIFDRQGKPVSNVGQPGLYNSGRFSPDGKRLVVGKNDPQTGINNLWVFDIATGKATAITNDTVRGSGSPIWSGDSKQIAYVQTKDSYSTIYRKSADGTGDLEPLFTYTPGAGIPLTDWSPDGRYLTFFNGALLIVPLRTNEKAADRKAIDWIREDYDAVIPRFSPDGRYLAYLSNEVDVLKMQLYVRPFDPAKPDAPSGPAVQITNVKGGIGGQISWRQDGKELYFVNLDREVMAVDVTPGPKFQVGAPRVLFKMPDPLAQGPAVSPDGERFVIGMPAK
jgi:eukaryotic-like serine/threonine-protein kinase